MSTLKWNASLEKSPTNACQVECVEGCECGPRYIDGWHDLHQSQTFLAALKVTQHEACVLAVTVEPSRVQGEAGNDRQGSKFKVSGVMLSESSEEKYDKDIPDGKWGMTGHADDNNEQIVITASGVEKATASSFCLVAAHGSVRHLDASAGLDYDVDDD
eukprot:365607-Chlamydomonas_euryale.AAC.15